MELKPSKNILDAFIAKSCLVYESKEVPVFFILFAYLFVFIVGFSLKSFEICIKVYNSIKWFILIDQKPSLNLLKEELLIEVKPYEMRIWRTKIKIM